LKTIPSSPVLWQSNDVITDQEEFHQFVHVSRSDLLQRSSGLVRRILQDMGQWTDNIAHEKFVLRLSFDLVERFVEHCPSQLPCRPQLLLDGFISDFFGRPQKPTQSTDSNPLLFRFLDGLLSRAVVSRDALICLFFHLYGMKPRDVGFLLGLEEGQFQRIYKNFSRWRQKGWAQALEEIGLTSDDCHFLSNQQSRDPQWFHDQLRKHLDTLLPFYRKSDPPYYPCLASGKWHEMFQKGYGFDYRMWHLPLCLSCMQTVARYGNTFHLMTDYQLSFHISPHTMKEEEMRWDGPKAGFISNGTPQLFAKTLQSA
jgi:hypothetical protein